MELSVAQINELFAAWFWPFVRILALLMVAPVFSGSMVSPRVRILLGVALTVVIAPLLPAVPTIQPFSVAGALVTAQQVIIGVAMGFALQMVFDALIVAGQAVAMSMGLGFAVAVDPQRGVNVPVVSQYFMVLATLIFLAINGHLRVIEVVVTSFATLPVGGAGLDGDGLWRLVNWGSEMFAGAVRIALPAMTALLVVNLAFGVISRAAPTLNLFAIGFPISMLLGFLILIFSVPNMAVAFEDMLDQAFANTGLLLRGGTP